MNIHKANLTNLTDLWKKYGAQYNNNSTVPLLYTNTHWPNRCWFDWNTISGEDIHQALQSITEIKMLLDNIPDSAIVSVWPMISASNEVEPIDQYSQLVERLLMHRKWICRSEQTAMYLDLKDTQVNQPLINTSFEIDIVTTAEGVKEWVDVGTEAFSYSIECTVIELLINDKDIQILLGRQNGQAITCGLLYKSDNVIGIHQLGVKQAFQGKGIAKYFMQEIMASCKRWRAKHIVLQASPEGQPLYDNLGFRTQFSIKNYHKL